VKMMSKSHRKFVLMVILAIIAVALLATLAIPAIAASPKGKTTETPHGLNVATVQGTLGVAGNIITVTANATSSVALKVTTGQTVNVIYNSSSGNIQGLMLNMSSQTLPTPKNPPNNNFAVVQGALTVVGNVLTITPGASPLVPLIAPSNAKVTIIYNKTTGVVQGLMANTMGRFPFSPKNQLNTNSANLHGTLAVSNNVITVTANATPSIALKVTAGQTVNVIYNGSSGIIQGLMLNRSGQTLPTPKNPSNNKFAIVQGTLTVAGNVLTITPSTTLSIALTAPSTAKVSIIYDKSTGTIQGLMLNMSSRPPFPPTSLPNQNGKTWNAKGPVGPSGFSGQQGMNRPGTHTMH
jgi:hypothetical protein